MSLLNTSLSPEGLTQLGGLLAGLDRLDGILQLPEVPEPGQAGLAFGRFRLTRRLGAGRFGIVLLAEDPTLRRRVVLKVPQPAVLADPPARNRFIREARSVARLDHPGIVPIFEAGEMDGLPYLVAAYVEGPTLAGWLRGRTERRMSSEQAASLIAKLAAAVQHAHERGVLHCDLNPSNILLLSPRGPVPEPVVTDFGLARLLEDDPKLTQTYQIAGTPLYMAPEQARGDRRNLTGRVDVYALGVILYELLTGEVPFTAESGARVLQDVIHRPPRPLHSLHREIPRDLEAVCLKCLEKDAANRYPTADALATDVERFLAGRPTTARPVGPITQVFRAVCRRPVTAMLAAATVLAMCALPAMVAWYSFRLEEAARAQRQAEQDADRDRELADTREFFASRERVRVRRLEQPPGWVDANLADLRHLATLAPADVHRHDLRSEAAAALGAVDLRPVRGIGEGFKAYAPAYSPDGSILALCGWQSLNDDWGVVRLYKPSNGELLRELTFPIDRKWARLRDKPDGCRAVAFSPDGRWLVAGTRGGDLVRWDLHDIDPRPIVWAAHSKDTGELSRVFVASIVFTANGRTMYSCSRERTLAWDIRAGWRQARQPGACLLPMGSPQVDEPAIAVRYQQDKRSNLLRIDGAISSLVELPVECERKFTATPDGRLVAAFAPLTGALCLISTDPVVRPVAFRIPKPIGGMDIAHMAFAPDQSLLATTEEHERRIKLWDVSSGELLVDRLVSGGSTRFAFSPDGRNVAVTEGASTVVYEITGRVRETFAITQRHQIETIAISRSGTRLLHLAGREGLPPEFALWDALGDAFAQLRQRTSLLYYSSDFPNADFHPENQEFVYTSSEKSLLDTSAEGDRVQTSGGDFTRCEVLSDLRYGPDGRLWGAGVSRVHVWTLPGWKEECPLVNDAAAQDAGMVFRAVAPGRRVSVVGRRDGQVFVLPSMGARPGPRKAFDSPVTSLALSPDETQAVIGGERGEVVILRLADGRMTTIPGSHGDAVQSIAYGPGGWFATGSADRTVKLWDEGGSPLLTLRPSGGVRRLAISDDGALLTALIDGERAVRRWRLDRLRRSLADLGLPLESRDGAERLAEQHFR